MFPGTKGGRCVGLTTLQPSCADSHEVSKPQLPGTLTDCYNFCFYMTINLLWSVKLKLQNNSAELHSASLLSGFTLARDIGLELSAEGTRYVSMSHKKNVAQYHKMEGR
jgi:hypothetical protein